MQRWRTAGGGTGGAAAAGTAGMAQAAGATSSDRRSGVAGPQPCPGAPGARVSEGTARQAACCHRPPPHLSHSTSRPAREPGPPAAAAARLLDCRRQASQRAGSEQDLAAGIATAAGDRAIKAGRGAHGLHAAKECCQQPVQLCSSDHLSRRSLGTAVEHARLPVPGPLARNFTSGPPPGPWAPAPSGAGPDQTSHARQRPAGAQQQRSPQPPPAPPARPLPTTSGTMANSEAADLMSVGQHCAVPDCQQVGVAWGQKESRRWQGRPPAPHSQPLPTLPHTPSADRFPALQVRLVRQGVLPGAPHVPLPHRHPGHRAGACGVGLPGVKAPRPDVPTGRFMQHPCRGACLGATG